MLYDQTSAIVVNPILLKSLREEHTETCAEHEHGVGQGKRKGVAGHHRGERELNRVAALLVRANIVLHNEQEHSDPKQREEALRK